MDSKSLDLYDSSFFLNEVLIQDQCWLGALQGDGTPSSWSTEQRAIPSNERSVSPYEIQVSIH